MPARSLPLTAILLVAACGPDFIEPNPPVLTRTTRSVSVPIRTEPVVFGIVNDLHILDFGVCERVLAEIERSVVESLSGRGLPYVQLTSARTSENCRQVSTRQLDLGQMDQEVRQLAAQFPSTRIRPVLLYLNNVALPPPEQIGQVITHWNPTGAPPLILGAVVKEGLHGRFDATVEWTFADDPTLPTAITSLFGESRFPLWSAGGDETEVQLISEEERGVVQAMKLCAIEGTVSVVGLPIDSSAIDVAPDRLPSAKTAEGPTAQTANAPRPPPVQLELELCTANCEGFTDFEQLGIRRRWLQQPGCALQAPEEEAP